MGKIDKNIQVESSNVIKVSFNEFLLTSGDSDILKRVMLDIARKMGRYHDTENAWAIFRNQILHTPPGIWDISDPVKRQKELDRIWKRKTDGNKKEK